MGSHGCESIERAMFVSVTCLKDVNVTVTCLKDVNARCGQMQCIACDKNHVLRSGKQDYKVDDISFRIRYVFDIDD